MRNRVKFASERTAEDGLSLIEVLVAMMIFSMLVIGIGYSLISVMQMTYDSQARETATSIASSELDAVRAIGNPFDVTNEPPRTQVVGTNTYTVTRAAGWVTPDGNIDICGTGGGTLQYKSVSVSVTWNGMRDGASPVLSDTALVPTTRINDPTKGTILVSVRNEEGLGTAGVTFTAKSATASLVTTPTNSDGCSYLLGVSPDDYTVKLTSSGYMDIGQNANPSLDHPVSAGSSAKFQFQYDKRGTYQLNYASNDSDLAVRPKIPNNMATTFFNANTRYSTTVPTSGLQGTTYLYPASTGYQVVAGNFVPSSVSGASCEVVDPAAWEEDTTKSPPAVGLRAAAAFSTPGGTPTAVGVPMGILTVTGSSSKPYLTALSQSGAPLPGQPTCDVAMEYEFGNTFGSGTSTVKIALPFGTWRLYSSSSASSLGSPVDASKIVVVTPGQLVGADGTFVLDPRGVTP